MALGEGLTWCEFRELLSRYVHLIEDFQDGEFSGFICASEFYCEKSARGASEALNVEGFLAAFSESRIAVVGNGFLPSGVGKGIDGHDVVIRINNYQITSACVEQTGEKTSVWCVNGSPAICFRDHSVALVPLTKDRAVSIEKVFPHAKLLFCKHDHLRELDVPRPTIGFALLVVLSSLGFDVAAYGFDFFCKTGHYWEPDSDHDQAHDDSLKKERLIAASLPGVTFKTSLEPAFKRSLLTYLRRKAPRLVTRMEPLKQAVKKALS